MTRLAAMCLALLFSSSSAQAPMYEWAGECPGGCRYTGSWTVARAAPAFPAPRTPQPANPLFTVDAGETVRVLTGTIYTTTAGVARMRDDFSTDASYPSLSENHRRVVTFRAGEEVTLLLPRLNGVWRILRDGRPIDANLYSLMERDACRRAPARCAGVIEKRPVLEWWVMVMNGAGQSGWIDQTDRVRTMMQPR